MFEKIEGASVGVPRSGAPMRTYQVLRRRDFAVCLRARDGEVAFTAAMRRLKRRSLIHRASCRTAQADRYQESGAVSAFHESSRSRMDLAPSRTDQGREKNDEERRHGERVEEPTRAFKDAKAWESWLAKNHATADGMWMRLAKKASGTKSITYPEAVDVALCYGWIDGLKRPESATAWLQRFTPRRTKSIWSEINREKALGLIASGRMQPAGLEQVERARRDGRWDAATIASRPHAEDFQKS